MKLLCEAIFCPPKDAQIQRDLQLRLMTVPGVTEMFSVTAGFCSPCAEIRQMNEAVGRVGDELLCAFCMERDECDPQSASTDFAKAEYFVVAFTSDSSMISLTLRTLAAIGEEYLAKYVGDRTRQADGCDTAA